MGLDSFDTWLTEDGPAALVIREHLMPVDGPDGVIFPPTFAAGDGFSGGYNIDEFPDGSNICLIDSVGSQANRMEPLFAKGPYAGLVPQVVIEAGPNRVNLLEAGHRAGDAIVRCSALESELSAAFRELLTGNAEPLARIAPTSLVFGVWDSRNTQAKQPRLIASTIRAFNTRKLRRSAQYVPATQYVEAGILDEAQDERTKKAYAERGFSHVPSSGAHGGVIATGGIRRDATLHLAALRLLAARDDEKTAKLRRYILGLALVAFTQPGVGYLRQGCTLVLDPEKGREMSTVYGDGRREPLALTPEEALEYAKNAAADFGIDPGRQIDFNELPDRIVQFDRERANRDVAGEGTKKTKKTRQAGAEAAK
jgi:CRISPR-associated protein Csb1